MCSGWYGSSVSLSLSLSPFNSQFLPVPTALLLISTGLNPPHANPPSLFLSLEGVNLCRFIF